MGAVHTKTRPLGYRELAVSTAVVSLADAEDPADATQVGVPRGSVIALISCEANDVRWRDDGTSPAATEGIVLSSGVTLEYDGNLNMIEFIRKTADATLHIAFYGV
jgi:hypothetical protein